MDISCDAACPASGEVRGDGPRVAMGAGIVVGAQAANMSAATRLVQRRLLVMI